MEQFNKKIRLIFIPFLIISIGTIGVYTFLHWIVSIKTHVINIDDYILDYIVAAVVPGIPIIIWLRPRIKLLDVTAYVKTARGGDPLTNYIMFAWFAIAFPIVITQLYLDTKSGKLTELDNISQIKSLPPTKYYIVRNFYLDKRLARVNPAFKVSGKHDQFYDMYLYSPCPFYSTDDTTFNRDKGTPFAWLTVEFQKTINNKLSKQIKDIAFAEFVVSSHGYFMSKPLNNFVYLERLDPSPELRNYLSAINSSYYPVLNKPIVVLSPVFEPYEARNGHKLPWIFASFVIGSLFFLLLLMARPFSEVAASEPIAKKKRIKKT
jgi:rhomboid protease GluP